MKSKELNILVVAVLAVLLVVAFDCLTGRAGSLEPAAPPGPTMVTLGQISSQIDALSSPVERVIRGVITFTRNGATELTQGFEPAVDPNRCLVLLDEVVAFSNRASNPTDYKEWIARTGACLVSLTTTEITVLVGEQPADQKVSYQIIEYK